MAFGIESFLLKILFSSIFKTMPVLSKGMEIVSSFSMANDVLDVVDSINNSNELLISDYLVRSDTLIDFLTNRLLDAGTDIIQVQEKKSGLHVSSRLTSNFNIPNYDRLRETQRARILDMISNLDSITHSFSTASSYDELKRLGPMWQQNAEQIKTSLSNVGISIRDSRFLKKLDSMDVETNNVQLIRSVTYQSTSLVVQYFRNKLLGLPVDHLY